MKAFVRLIAFCLCVVTALNVAIAEPEYRPRYDYDDRAPERVYDGREVRHDGDGITLPKIVNKIGRGLRRIGGHLEHFFTGRRTIDRYDR
jgi:hypothetical protein